ncbi:MAG: hypothetical protein IKZ58_10485 [Selenomonadaceae bacterium]|nr:hypothetical protein [Selenomonadaceae bacterium]
MIDMVATIILGICIAGGFAYGMKRIYNNFSKGKAACCNCSDCSHCAKCHKA